LSSARLSACIVFRAFACATLAAFAAFMSFLLGFMRSPFFPTFAFALDIGVVSAGGSVGSEGLLSGGDFGFNACDRWSSLAAF
jgi:hypothetical protein